MCGFPPLLSAECSPRYCGPTTMASLIGVQRTAPGQQRRRTDLPVPAPDLPQQRLPRQRATAARTTPSTRDRSLTDR